MKPGRGNVTTMGIMGFLMAGSWREYGDADACGADNDGKGGWPQQKTAEAQHSRAGGSERRRAGQGPAAAPAAGHGQGHRSARDKQGRGIS